MNIGIDTVNYDRVKYQNEFAKKVLCEQELKEYDSSNNKLEFLCSRFCVKEALVKALDDKTINYKKVRLNHTKSGKPLLEYKNYNLLVSLSHEKDHCVAIVVAII